MQYIDRGCFASNLFESRFKFLKGNLVRQQVSQCRSRQRTLKMLSHKLGGLLYRGRFLVFLVPIRRCSVEWDFDPFQRMTRLQLCLLRSLSQYRGRRRAGIIMVGLEPVCKSPRVVNKRQLIRRQLRQRVKLVPIDLQRKPMSQFSNVLRFFGRDALEGAAVDHSQQFALVDHRLAASLPQCHPNHYFVETREYTLGGTW